MTPSPSVLLFDVNETLSDMAPMAGRFADVGAPTSLAATWFASLLRDGFALTVTGENPAFAQVARGVLGSQLTEHVGRGELDDAVEHVLSGFGQLDVHPDVVDGVRALGAAGVRLVTLSNGSADVARGLLDRAGVLDCFERLLSVEQAPRWKPAPEAYAYALEVCGVPASEAMLVAVHPWDLHGARAAGVATAWIDRAGGRYPDHMAAPDVTATGLGDLARQLGAGGA
ncbi:haloacid dehalogenase type II [Serinicoccus kebangsaanensis]|uniref:haloacid dehalogenase type II n=1 Tax=Serinicoccus kebangsaanensis TaxID=2602069 RepID=UPI00124C0091|nr:haloacid dehalogenase type II [Serinicoccus kebangsaanensis]